MEVGGTLGSRDGFVKEGRSQCVSGVRGDQ